MRPLTLTFVIVAISQGGCFEPRYKERTGIFRGYWTTGFEENSFVPCAGSVPGLARAWVELAPSVQMPEITVDSIPEVKHPWVDSMLRDGPQNVTSEQDANVTVFVTWHGVLKGPRESRSSRFTILVDSVLSVRATGPATCRRP